MEITLDYRRDTEKYILLKYIVIIHVSYLFEGGQD